MENRTNPEPRAPFDPSAPPDPKAEYIRNVLRILYRLGDDAVYEKCWRGPDEWIIAEWAPTVSRLSDRTHETIRELVVRLFGPTEYDVEWFSAPKPRTRKKEPDPGPRPETPNPRTPNAGTRK